MKNKTVSARDAARMLQVNLAYVYQLCWAGRLDGAHKDGKTWIIPLETVQKRLKTNTGGK